MISSQRARVKALSALYVLRLRGSAPCSTASARAKGGHARAWRAYVQLKGQSKTSKHHPDTSHLPKSIALVPEFSHSLLEFHQLQSKKEPGDTLQLSLFWYVSSQAFFAGISTDVSLMVTELMESVKEIQSQLQENSDRISEGRDFTVRSS